MASRKRKRQYGSGAVVAPKSPRGTWGVRVRAGGRRQYRGGFATRELAERVLAKLQVDSTAEEFGLPVSRSAAGTLGEYTTSFLARRKLTHEAHAEDAGRWRNHLAPTFAHLRPDDVDHGVVRRFAEKKLAEGLASGTVRILVALLSSLYVELIEDGLARSNPARGLPKATARLLKPSHDPRTTPFIERLSDVRRIYADLADPLNVAYAIGALAGLRTAEVFGLLWRHVDLDARRIHVREQRGRAGRGKMLKDKESRIVPIMDGLLPLLRAWKLRQGGEGDAPVIPPMRSDGTRLAKATPGRHLAKTLKRLGLERPGLGWYEATRHTFASQWVMNGGSIEKLKEILGHYSVVVTERYAHLHVELFTARDLGTIPLEFDSQQVQSLGNPAKIGQDLASSAPLVLSSWPISSMGWMTPISLLTVMMETIAVSGRKAASSSCRSMRPFSLTPRYVTSKPSSCSFLAESRTHLCSVCVVMMWFFLLP